MSEFDQQEYTKKYNKSNYDRLELNLPKGAKETLKQQAKDDNLSLSKYILKCIDFYEENKS